MANQDAVSPSERQALAALDAGEIDEALKALVAGYKREILAYCIMRLGDETIAADVAQDVFVAVWKALPGFRRESSLRTWLFAIARNRCTRCEGLLGRFRGIFCSMSDTTGADMQPDPEDSPEELLRKKQQEKQQAEQLRLALAKLTRKERDLLTMRYNADLSLNEIAACCQVAPETVRQRVIRAQQHLKKHLKQLMDD